jgi:hypothetical protein
VVVLVDVLVVDVLVVDVLDEVDVLEVDVLEVDVVEVDVLEVIRGTVVVVAGCVEVTTIGRAWVVARPSDCAVELQAVNAPATKRSSVLARRSATQRTVAPRPRRATAPAYHRRRESRHVHAPRHGCRRQPVE